MICSFILMSFSGSEKIFYRHGRESFSTSLLMSFRTLTRYSLILLKCLQHRKIICLSWEMMTSPSIVSVGQDRSLCCILKTIIRRQSRFYWIPITVHKKRSWRHHSVSSDVIRNVSKRRFRRTRRQENRLSMQCLKARGKRSPKLSGIYRRIWTEAADTKILPFFSGRIRSRRC